MPSRGWASPVRVCADCFTQRQDGQDGVPDLDAPSAPAASLGDGGSAGSAEPAAPSRDDGRLGAADRPRSPSAGAEIAERVEHVPRRISETVSSTAGYIRSAARRPCQLLTDWMAPDYWERDELITACFCCQTLLGSSERKHHCRACGKGVCASCSPWTHKVPWRGWTNPVRVCNKCHENCALQEKEGLELLASAHEQGMVMT